MPRYFFHVINGSVVPDPTGDECATLDEVKAQAVIAAGEALRDLGLQLWKTGRWHMFVADEQAKVHLKLTFEAEDLTGELR